MAPVSMRAAAINPTGSEAFMAQVILPVADTNPMGLGVSMEQDPTAAGAINRTALEEFMGRVKIQAEAGSPMELVAITAPEKMQVTTVSPMGLAE